MPPSTTLYDTIIAGAGPVGLFLACELSLAGCSVLVLEQARDPSSPLKRAPFGLRGLSLPSVESLDRRGFLDEIASQAASGAGNGALDGAPPSSGRSLCRYPVLS
jgi:2-polyprenyl-6-methoxyphenol hydroxylase-like FAD-dependent oxidoreductase